MAIPIVQRTVLSRSNPEVRRINTSSAGTGSLAAGVDQAGRAITQGLSGLGARQERNAARDKRAHDAEIARMRRMVTGNANLDLGDSTLSLQNEFDTVKGKDTLEAGEKALRSYDENMDRIAGDISDRPARESFELTAKSNRLLFRRHVTAHQSSEIEIERKANEARSIDQAGEFAAKAAVRGDFDAAAEYGFDVTAPLGDIFFAEEDAAKAKEVTAAAQSSVHVAVLSALMQDGQAQQAEGYFEKHSGEINPKVRGELKTQVTNSARKVRSAKAASEVWAGSVSKDTGEPNIGRALAKLQSMAGKMHPDVFAGARENVLGFQKRKTETERLSDDPLTDVLMLRFIKDNVNVENEQEFNQLSYNGKVAILERIIQDKRSKASAGRAYQNFIITGERRVSSDERQAKKDVISAEDRQTRLDRQLAGDIRRDKKDVISAEDRETRLRRQAEADERRKAKFDFAQAERDAKKHRREAKEMDDLEESRFDKLFVVSPDGGFGNDQMTVDLNKFKFSEIRRNKIEAERTRMIESRSKLGGVKHTEMLNTLEGYIDEHRFNEGKAGRFRRDFLGFYHAWERTNRDLQAGGPKPEEVSDFLARAHVGSRRKKEDQGFIEKVIGGRTIPAFEIRADGNVPAALNASEKDALQALILKSRDIDSFKADAVGRKVEPFILRYQKADANGDMVVRTLSVTDRALIGKKRATIRAAGWEVLN